MRHTDTKEELIRKIQELSGISRSTIFRYFAGKQVRESSKQKICNALTFIESGNCAKEEQKLEIVVPVNSHNFDDFKGYGEVLSGILDEASQKGITVRLEHGQVNYVENRRGTGVIILGKDTKELEYECTQLKKQQIPFVLINRTIDKPGISYVAVDVRQGAYDMATHLLDQGYRRIAFWGTQNNMVSQGKLAGLKDALTERNIPYDEDIIETDTEKHPLEETFDHFMKMENKPDAFMTMDDETALRVIRLAFMKNIQVPRDLGVSGMNDIESSENVIPSISSIHYPFRTLGILAVDTLWNLLHEQQIQSIRMIIGHKIILRDSTKKGI
jgi:LacI family transcriptional regulator